MFDVITIGSNTVDVFATTDPSSSDVEKIHGHRDICYPLGAKILIKDLEFFVGGGGTNTAVSFARLGLRTGYLGKIGKDENGLKVFKCLKYEHIEFIGSLGNITGYSVILDSTREDRTILTYKGCNNDLSLKDKGIHPFNLRTKWFYFSTMIDKSFKAQEQLVEIAKRNNSKIAFNPSSYQAKKGVKFLGKILKHTEVLVLNKEEAVSLLNAKIGTKILDLLKKIVEVGVKIAVITDGSKGAYCYNSYNKNYYFVAPKKNLKIVETTGAGDAFASTFVSGIIYNKNTEFCMKMAINNAESVITHYGAKNILLNKNKLFGIVKRDKRKVIKQKVFK